jgi:hypothetical protein
MNPPATISRWRHRRDLGERLDGIGGCIGTGRHLSGDECEAATVTTIPQKGSPNRVA